MVHSVQINSDEYKAKVNELGVGDILITKQPSGQATVHFPAYKVYYTVRLEDSAVGKHFAICEFLEPFTIAKDGEFVYVG